MSVLVTGGAGYIGSHVVLELLKAGEEPIVLDDLSTGFREAVPDVVKFVRGDVGDEKLVTRAIAENDVDAIIHLAGSIVVPRFGERPARLLFQQHVQIADVDCLCHQGQAEALHLLFERCGLWPAASETAVTEEAELRPISPYGSSKLMTEIMLRDAAIAFPMRYVALRYFNVAGQTQKAGRANPRQMPPT